MLMMNKCTPILATLSVLFLTSCELQDDGNGKFTLSLNINPEEIVSNDEVVKDPVIEVPTEAPTEPVNQNCGDILEGQDEERVRYLNATETVNSCQGEIQTRMCSNGAFTAWNGTFLNAQCTKEENLHELVTAESLKYQGGFRLSSSKYGETDNARLSYSPGTIAFNSENNSLYVVGHSYEQGIAEFKIPNVVNSLDMNDFEVGDTVLQNFSNFYETERVDTGIDNFFRITGMEKIGSKLVVNYINWYDANGTETDTSIVYENADDLANSDIYGPFQIEGAAHASGWLTEIPDYFQDALGGTYLGGWASGSINSRLSIGPSGFVMTPEENLLLSTVGGTVASTPVLDFNLDNMLYDIDNNPDGVENTQDVLYNVELNNDLWTISSRASYGFIVPDSDTYITVGYSAGHESGLGYKITQDDGTLCGGACSVNAADKYSYFWMWKISDLIKVKSGELLPHEVRPYEYGKLDLPSNAELTGGAFDKDNMRLYLSLAQGDTVELYSRPPIFFVYDIER